VAVIGNQRQSETIREAISEAIRDHQRGNQRQSETIREAISAYPSVLLAHLVRLSARQT